MKDEFVVHWIGQHGMFGTGLCKQHEYGRITTDPEKITCEECINEYKSKNEQLPNWYLLGQQQGLEYKLSGETWEFDDIPFLKDDVTPNQFGAYMAGYSSVFPKQG